MRVREAVANMVGLGACVALTWAIRGMQELVIPIGGSCGGRNARSCPAGIGRYAVVFVAAMLVSIIAGMIGSRWIFAGQLLAVGIGTLLATGSVAPHHRLFPSVFGAVLVLAGLTPVVLIPWRSQLRRQAGIASATEP